MYSRPDLTKETSYYMEKWFKKYFVKMDKKGFFRWIRNQIITVSLNLKVAKTQILPILNTHGANYQFRKNTFLAH